MKLISSKDDTDAFSEALLHQAFVQKFVANGSWCFAFNPISKTWLNVVIQQGLICRSQCAVDDLRLYLAIQCGTKFWLNIDVLAHDDDRPQILEVNVFVQQCAVLQIAF
jgi:hypothetical protein